MKLSKIVFPLSISTSTGNLCELSTLFQKSNFLDTYTDKKYKRRLYNPFKENLELPEWKEVYHTKYPSDEVYGTIEQRQERDRKAQERGKIDPQDIDLDFDAQHNVNNWPESIIKFKYLLKTGRHTKILPGGRVMSFSVLLLGGDGFGTASFGYGKGDSPSNAMKEAERDIWRNILTIQRTTDRTIPYNIAEEFCRTRIKLYRRPLGFGISAGPLMFPIVTAFGFKDITAVKTGTNNIHNLLQCFWKALKKHCRITEHTKIYSRGLSPWNSAKPFRTGSRARARGNELTTDAMVEGFEKTLPPDWGL